MNDRMIDPWTIRNSDRLRAIGIGGAQRSGDTVLPVGAHPDWMLLGTLAGVSRC
jgi:hypothetical protein